MMSRTNVRTGAVARQKRQERAKERAAGGSPEPAAQLALLDSRLGKDRGAKKERDKLKALIDPGRKKKTKGKK